jgi:hypothetical protein
MPLDAVETEYKATRSFTAVLGMSWWYVGGITALAVTCLLAWALSKQVDERSVVL